MPESCYLCGRGDLPLTADHIPPKVLFPQPRPSDLITVRACGPCNQGLSKDDELLAVFLSAAVARNEAGRWVWENKALKSVLARSTRLAIQLLKDTRKTAVLTELGIAEMDILTIPEARLRNVLIRIAKGLIRHLDKGFDYTKLNFSIQRLWPTAETAELVRQAAQKMTYIERGSGAFRCLYGLTPPPSRQAMFFFIFYDAVGFIVTGEHPV